MTKRSDGSFQTRTRSIYPIGAFVRVRLVSGRETEARIVHIETTELGTFLRVEFGEEVASVTVRQIVGFYDFCMLKGQIRRRPRRSNQSADRRRAKDQLPNCIRASQPRDDEDWMQECCRPDPLRASRAPDRGIGLLLVSPGSTCPVTPFARTCRSSLLVMARTTANFLFRAGYSRFRSVSRTGTLAGLACSLRILRSMRANLNRSEVVTV
jgi:hypothetical protein